MKRILTVGRLKVTPFGPHRNSQESCFNTELSARVQVNSHGDKSLVKCECKFVILWWESGHYWSHFTIVNIRRLDTKCVIHAPFPNYPLR